MKTTFFIVSALSVAANAIELMNGPLVETNVYGNGENDGPLIEVNIDADGDGPLVEVNVDGNGENSEPLVELNVYGGSDHDSSSEFDDGDCDDLDFDPNFECYYGWTEEPSLDEIFETFDINNDGDWEFCEFYKAIVC